VRINYARGGGKDLEKIDQKTNLEKEIHVVLSKVPHQTNAPVKLKDNYVHFILKSFDNI
jgi:hypothetical protein